MEEDPGLPALRGIGRLLYGMIAFLSVMAAGLIGISVFRECERAAMISAGQEACRVWDGWYVLAVLFLLAAAFFGYRAYRMAAAVEDRPETPE